ncbi:MAG TPA: ATP-dependent DNA helicase [Nanoarchaeota archaeon]|nr:ATP-dependent DNA helicase [Nanoarchaeota archaeon]
MQNLFPYDSVRPVQSSFMEQVENALNNKKHLLAHCPTGVGKTAAALTPAIEFALKNKLTVFFLTSRHTQHMIAVETVAKIKDKAKIDLVCMDVIGKKHMCGQNGVDVLTSSEFSEYCKAIREKEECEHYNNLKEKGKASFDAEKLVLELKKTPMHAETLVRKCKTEKLCPFEIACMIGKAANVVIADYNHVLHPGIRGTLFKKTGKILQDSIVILDEAHNLPARARKLLTFSLSTYSIEQAAKEAKSLEMHDTAEHLAKLMQVVEKLASKMPPGKQETLATKQELFQEIEAITNYELFITSLHAISEEILETKKKSFSTGIANFLEAWTGQDKGFTRIIANGFTKLGKPFTAITYRCLDPSIPLRELLANARSVIAMSGTLTPTEMYKDLLGFENALCAEYESPFPKENRLNLIVPKTSTKYTARSPWMYEHIGRRCAEIANTIPGNSAIFFPSYRLMDDIYVIFSKLCERTIFVEQPGMGKDEKAMLLDSFKAYKDSGAVLLAVSAGSFGEGIDLMGDFLKGVVIVGLPLTRPDLETEQLIKYYDEKYSKGWDYGYTMPAIITTMQNAGRCIRSETDRGVIVFLDERYVWPAYYKCFPKEWSMKVSLDARKEIEEFFGKAA